MRAAIMRTIHGSTSCLSANDSILRAYVESIALGFGNRVGPEKAIGLRSCEKRDFSTEACASFWRLQSHARATLFVEGHDAETFRVYGDFSILANRGENRVAKMAIIGARYCRQKRQSRTPEFLMQYAKMMSLERIGCVSGHPTIEVPDVLHPRT
jgi:hypothetical protein